MNKLTFFILLATLGAGSFLGAKAIEGKADLDVQWGEYQRLRISPGEVRHDE